MKWNYAIGIVVVLVGCGTQSNSDSKQESEQFESLLVLVEEGENILETTKLEWLPAQDALLRCAASSSFCEWERSRFEDALTSAREAFDFQGLSAQLQSLRLTENLEASRARDSFVKHLRAWRESIEIFLAAVRQSSPDSVQSAELLDRFRENGNLIQESFDNTCSGLGNAQPAGSDLFKARIVDICDD